MSLRGSCTSRKKCVLLSNFSRKKCEWRTQAQMTTRLAKSPEEALHAKTQDGWRSQ